MLTGPTVVAPVLPATSVAVPPTYWLAPSVASVLSAGQPPTAMPDSASEQVKWTPTGPLYHPSAFGLVIAAPVMLGAMLSILRVRLWPLAVLSSTLPAESLLQNATVCTPLPTSKRESYVVAAPPSTL